ncbi:ATPase, V1/A1 complex, subunit E [Basidiobolus meristosporus CBS 931.73]|uniref:ATPase, V1/A1 complex, subunit E n=1 Tax=Basidiobolus meristosporus CBS 931.73 TaxID=1314790 RepID=A0A1Y1YRP3_9FUNG|nr:ATPase, V1/A1 complex, subunit E [Basidiobolus meristosporus CBS 931.73]|eukprot:ORY00703.1 ATPase, V1/A1 complex, subunit E [Basidiobolus meristosporus CBS 931.73]
MSRPLNDQEVLNEMNKMVAFIKQEAQEKAREIKVKADEEFNIEKAKLIRQESINIDTAFDRKVKQADVQRRIAQSNVINKSRLQLLATRQQLLNDLFAEATERLKSVSQDKSSYQVLIKDLVLQGLYQLMDKKVNVVCRQADVSIVENAIKEAQQEYQKAFNTTVDVTIDKNEFLPKDSNGGVILSSLEGRVKCHNTLESRLELLKDQMLPDIRYMLFGHSPSRKFFN